jgi:3',5'-cyclic AMP phosphodiesterase CpdA
MLPYNERWYSFNNGPIHFVGLDSNQKNAFRLFQLLWLIKDLKSDTKNFTIVFFHHPVYSSGNHGSTWYVKLLWKNIFEKYEIDIVFNGHDHCYERSKVKNINYVVAGGGGAPLYDVGSNWWTVYSEKTYHYCYISANQTQLLFNAIKPDGSIIDTFSK